MKNIFSPPTGETRNPDTFIHTYFHKFAFYIRKSQYTHFSKFFKKCSTIDIVLVFVLVCFPMFEINIKIKFETLGCHFGFVKKQTRVFCLFRLFSGLKCLVFEITLSSYHSF